ncbi:MAG: hypothetical protein AABZ74_14610 [Cyanobacteriota bacterium]
MDIQSNFTEKDIELISQVTFRIECNNGKGTAVLIANTETEIFIVTAKHCILGEDFSKSFKINDVKFFAPLIQDDKKEFNLTENDEILFPEDDTLDLCLIVLKKQYYKKLPEKFPNLLVSKISYTTSKCLFRGFPKGYKNLEAINIIDVKFSDYNVVTTQHQLSSIHNEALSNCKGFSGGGLFASINNQCLLVGIIAELNEPFQRFQIVTFQSINNIFLKYGYQEIIFTEIAKDISILEDINKIDEITRKTLNRIPNFLPNKFTLKRNDVIKPFLEKFKDNELLIISGLSGIGKSSLIKNALISSEQTSDFIIALPATAFIKESIEEELKIQNSFNNIIKQIGLTQKIVIFIDSLEKILETGNFENLKDLLSNTKYLQNIKLLFVFRNYANQQLILNLYNFFPEKFAFFDVPLLNENDLEEVFSEYPGLKKLSLNNSIKLLLKRPFYLNQIILFSSIINVEKELTEREFKKLIWREVITQNNSEREKVFKQIALKRAFTMSLSVKIEVPNKEIIENLYKDHIITIEEHQSDYFSPSHDIFEDIALIKFIEEAYLEKTSPLDFINKLNGNEPAKIRALRLWLTDEITELNFDLNSFIIEFLLDKNIEKIWKNEVLIAILSSENCSKFFEENEELIKNNNFSLLEKSIHLLRTACQKPNKLLDEILSGKEEIIIYGFYLKPSGPGWEVIIGVITKYYKELDKLQEAALNLIVNDWANTININNPLPKESKIIGNFLLERIEEIKENDAYSEKYSSSSIKSIIRLLFNLTEHFKDEVKDLIHSANKYFESEVRDYKLIALYDNVIDNLLSFFYSSQVCKYFPDDVCLMAFEKWTSKKRKPGRNYGSLEIEEEYGLNSSRFNCFPPGIFNTPIFWLLKYNYPKALILIIDIINYSTDSYSQSQLGKNTITEIEIILDNKTIIKQKGNLTLWTMYRGTSNEATPYLLQSILMTLEKWFLDLCKNTGADFDDVIGNIFDFLIKNSTSVAITSILVSTSLASLNRIKSRALPFLRIKELYYWDLNRCTLDYGALSLIDRQNPYHQEERIYSNKLPHRNKSLAFLITELQGLGLNEEVNNILDEFYKTGSQEDIEWQILLNRFDLRNFELDENYSISNPGKIAYKAKLKQEYIDYLEIEDKAENNKIMALNITNWAIQKYENTNNPTTFEEWEKIYDSYQKIIGNLEGEIAQLISRTHIAAIAIRDFFSKLSFAQKNWCIEIILKAVANEINRHRTRDFFLFHELDTKPAINVLPLILQTDISKKQENQIKILLFSGLLYLVSNEIIYPFETFKKNVWNIDIEFAESCFWGLIEYSKIHKYKRVGYLYEDRTNNAKKNIFQKLKERFCTAQNKKNLTEDELTNLVIQGTINKEFNNVDLKTHSDWFLVFSLMILPKNINNEIFVIYYLKIFDAYFFALNHQEKYVWDEDYVSTNIRNYQQTFAKFVLCQQKKTALESFSYILDKIFLSDDFNKDSLEFVEKIIEEIVLEGIDNYNELFWDLLNILEVKIKNSKKIFFIDYLFLNLPWFSGQNTNWEPLKTKKFYYKNLIEELGENAISSVIKLLFGIGKKALLPECFISLVIALKKTNDPLKILKEKYTFKFADDISLNLYNTFLKDIEENTNLKNYFLTFLDLMIESGSSYAFTIKEKLISL